MTPKFLKYTKIKNFEVKFLKCLSVLKIMLSLNLPKV